MKAMTEEQKKSIKQSAKKRNVDGRVSKSEQNMSRTLRLTILGFLTAIIFLMSFTPLGYLPVGPLKLTFLTLPVIVAATILSPADAAIIGGMFGLTSFIQAFTGMSVMTGALFQLNPFLTFLLCVVPRVLEGLLGGLIFQGLKKVDKSQVVSYLVTSLSVPVLNTLLFMSALYAEIKIIDALNTSVAGLDESFLNSFNNISGAAGGSVIAFFLALVGTQALVEAGVCFVLGSAVSKALALALKRLGKSSGKAQKK